MTPYIPMKSVPSTIDALKRMAADTTDESIKKALLNAIKVMEEKKKEKEYYYPEGDCQV